MNHDGSTFLSGCAPVQWYIFFAKEADDMAEEGQPNSTFFVFDERDPAAPFRKCKQSVAWPAVAMATIRSAETNNERVAVAVGPRGSYWEIEAGIPREHLGEIPNVRGHIRDLAVIAGRVYGCGMGRMALLRESRGNWRDFGPPDGDGSHIVGFEGIDGFAANDIYAVGWSGEIWHYNGETWRQIDSPASRILSAVCCAEDGVVYAVGQDGVLVRGRNDRWEIVPTGRAEDLMDVKMFEGQLYVVSNFTILKLTEAGLVPDTDFPDDARPSTCLHLVRASDGLVSVGQKDLWTKKSGSTWRRLV